MYERRLAKTAVGMLEVCFTDLEHAHVFTPSDNVVSVRGKEYTVSVHLNLTDGDWITRKGGYSSVTKSHWTNYSQSSAAPTIAAKVVDCCRHAVYAVLADEPELPVRAEVARLRARVATLSREQAELSEAAHQKVLEMVECHKRREEIDPECLYGPLGGAMS